MKNILLLSAKEAKEFFLKEESYFNFDLPPYFKFDNLLQSVSKKIKNKKLSDFYSPKSKPRDFEDVNYTLITNKDGRYAWRPLQLIHPALYVYLVNEITEDKNWQYITDRLRDLIKKSNGIECKSLPVISAYYKKNKAAQIKNWSEEVERKSIIYSLDYDYLFHTDITDCYGSIYTHSITWALHDKAVAKKERENKKLIGNIIDWQLQAMSNGQTNGISQGSVLMDFIAEIVLYYVDSLLADKIKTFKKADYKIIRYRDDYRIFSNNPQVAEQIIKELTDILNDFGMKINSAKTKGINDVVHSSIKPDKLFWMVNENKCDDLNSEIFSISVFAEKYPNSGTVAKLLMKYYDKISKSSRKDIKANIKVLISVITDIAFKNPRTYPIISAILSKLIDFMPKKDRDQITRKILNKFKKLPNTGIMQLWLQRITIKTSSKFDYSEKLCSKIDDNSVVIWNSDWLKPNLRKIIDSYDLVDRKILESLGAVISDEEVSLFDKLEYF
ncbi:MAG TPA: RNA-directed DNA polymerase [Syntrophorhabdaceae bacterium]|nr:RNA-directed DNA polymerase [Syntrophorhabdaceae bacterium]